MAGLNVSYTANGLSALLRTQLNAGSEADGVLSGKELDIRDEKTRNKLTVSRLLALKRKREARARSDGGGGAGEHKQLTWAAFSVGATQSTPGLGEMRVRFQSFIKTLQSVVGEDRASSVLFHSAHIMFKALTLSTPGGAAQQRKLLENYFGRIPDAVFTSLLSHATELNAWRTKALPAAAAAAASTATAADAKSAAASRREFGADLKFALTAPAAPVPIATASGITIAPATTTLQRQSSANRPAPVFSSSAVFSADLLPGEDDDLSEDEPDTVRSATRNAGSSDRKSAPAASSSATGAAAITDWKSLRRACERFSTFNDFGEQELSDEYFATSILSACQSPVSDEKLNSTLEGLLGIESMEFIFDLVSCRSTIRNIKPTADKAGSKSKQEASDRAMALRLSKSDNSGVSAALASGHATSAMSVAAAAQASAIQANLIGVRITSDTQKKLDQIKKKEARKMARQTVSVAPAGEQKKAEALDQAKLDEQANALARWARDPNGKVSGDALPAGAVRTMEKTYEQVMIPPAFPEPIRPDDLVDVKSLSEFAQAAFEGTKRLNAIQSKCFNTAYKSNENMLVCAPTGAGKTNIALLTIVHEIEQHIEHGVLQKDMFKIVYVAPMKALAQEIVSKFERALGKLGITVKELTGDTQMSKKEIKECQIIVTTPEKWDVMTRKSGDGALISMVRLLIIDEVHLLHEDRGPVIEILVARTLRHVESSQQMCRIVGLSATLPNYTDVAEFLKVNAKTGLHFFGGEYRPVPLTQYYVGVKEKNPIMRMKGMVEIAYRKALASVQAGNQVMIFVHARSDTSRTGLAISELAASEGVGHYFSSCADNPGSEVYKQKVARCRNREFQDLFPRGFGIHHAGMLRSDRALVEKAFAEGYINVLVCTATLAWGVNLPAHTVIIKGTQIYDAKRGGFVDVGMLDVMQIFGRAGRPQFDTTGEAILITAHDKLAHYLALLNHAMPIESQFISALPDHLNAEIILGTVTNLNEALAWMGYTYLYIRMVRNPMAYGATYDEQEMDHTLGQRRKQLVLDAAKALMQCRMVRFDVKSGNFFTTDVGRVASYYYIHHSSVETYNNMLKPMMNDEEILHLLASSKEFEQLRAREEEQDELSKLGKKACPIKIKGGLDGHVGKANVLLQVYISQAVIDAPTLISDSHYITQSAGRIARALFEMVLKRGLSYLAHKLLEYAKMVDRRIWYFQTPLRQFSALKPDIIKKLEDNKAGNIDTLIEMSAEDIGTLLRQQKMGATVLNYCRQIPYVQLSATVQPVTRTVLRVTLIIRGDFKWNANAHGTVEPFWIWVEDDRNEHIYHTEYFLLHRKTYEQEHKLEFTIPIFEPLPPQYFIRAVSDRWLGSETTIAISFKHLMLPELHPPHTPLLDLQPMPVTALRYPGAESMYKFTHFNPIQTQVFHCCYHTDSNVLLGAPTGSGKTIVAELCILRLFREYPNAKVVYVAPMKALARERLEDWRSERSFGGAAMGKRTVVELTGDTTPDQRLLQDASIIITTPEKWDGISRSWASRSYVKSVGLVIIDEIHLLGGDRGPVLEVIVSRARYISSHTASPVRIVGLSTALANARDLGDWLGIEPGSPGLYNFEPLVRPVPLTIHISGFEGKHYCPRMATMNKPAYASIMTYSPKHPVLVFVSSRRQTRLTALDLVSFSAADGDPRKFLRGVTDKELEQIIGMVKDTNLKHVLSFGIGLHHAGLVARDRAIVEDLFLHQKIQVLVCTATLAWGINLPARLVVIKGTEYYDAKVSRYVDFPVTDVLQMIGRAGRPQFDDKGTACVLVHAPKKNFYMKFLHSPFPVESSLAAHLPDHLNAEIVSGTITSVQDAVDYLSWTFFFRRLLVNPSYYNPELKDTSEEGLNKFMIELVRKALKELETAGCCTVNDSTDDSIDALSLGKIASFYYLKHTTVRMFSEKLTSGISLPLLLDVLSAASEYDELPVRHNEDKLNEEMSGSLKWPVDAYSFDSPHTKANILFQAHLQRLPLPISDYGTDTSSVLDQAIRILQAMVDVSAEAGWLNATLKIMTLTQMIIQARLITDSTLLNLPHINTELLNALWKDKIETLPEVMSMPTAQLSKLAGANGLGEKQIADLIRVVSSLPLIDVRFQLSAQLAAEDEPEADAKSAANPNADNKHSDGAAPKPKSKPAAAVVKSTGKHNSLSCVLGSEITVELNLRRANKQAAAGPASRKVWAPRFPKPKDEGWWVLVGSASVDECMALKRIVIRPGGSTRTSLTFQVPEAAGVHKFVVYLISDSYLGLDQQYDFSITAI